MTSPRIPRQLRPRSLATALAVIVASAVTIGALRENRAAAAPPRASSPSSQAKYLGRWNYDQPNRESGRNIAVVSGAGFAQQVPQIGDIVFARGADGGIVGHTDQGCTWRFAARPGSLELASPAQDCFNQVIGSGYTITRWSVTVSGRHEHETIVATSHLPAGDYEFVLATGRRTRVENTSRLDQTRRFVGTWRYDVADPQSGVNILTIVDSGAGGEQVHQSPQGGYVTVTKRDDNAVIAQSANGCRSSLTVRGNTAELAPAGQTCQLSNSTVTLRFWSIASDGKHQASIMNGVDESATTRSSFLLSIGALTRIDQ